MMKWLYQEGKNSRTGEHTRYPKPKQGLLWVLAVKPTEKEITSIAKDFHLPIKVLRNYTKERRSVRYSFEPFACTFVDYHKMEGKIRRENVIFFVGGNFIVTVLAGPIGCYERVFSEMAEKANKSVLNSVDILVELMDDDIEENYDLLELIENEITQIERELALRHHGKIDNLVELRRTLNRMSRALWGSSRLTYFLKLGLSSIEINDLQMRRIDDLHESVIHQLDIISNYKEMLTDAITIYQTNISNWLATISNKINTGIRLLTWIMLLLTGLTLVLTVPNTLATIFGIPSIPLSASDWPMIMIALVAAVVIPTIMFFIYWVYVKRKADEAEKQV
jgi:Mg2+ and Co2+ transporter CorA